MVVPLMLPHHVLIHETVAEFVHKQGGEWDLPTAPGELSALSANTNDWINKNSGVLAFPLLVVILYKSLCL
jgi:hypothetical protein